jgi:plasmid segregation protein ParM
MKKTRRNKHIMNYDVIGIDHGWSQMKTASKVFTSGVKLISTEPATMDNVVELDGKYYRVGGDRMPVTKTKVENENYYVLTLAAVAMELERRGKRDATVVLAVGLPLTRFGAERKDFLDYLWKRQDVDFFFEKRRYHIHIENIMVFPQCYAAVADQLWNLKGKQLIVDVGSWTVDVLPIKDGAPDEGVTKPMGLITCMQDINNECVRQCNGELDESLMQDFMITGKSMLEDEYLKIAEDEVKKFVSRVYGVIGELGYNINTIPVIFVGGGAKVIKRYSKPMKNIRYVEDVKANARGYEFLAKLAAKRKAV